MHDASRYASSSRIPTELRSDEEKAGPQRGRDERAGGERERPGGERENRVSGTIGDLLAAACQRFANRSALVRG